MDNKQQDKASEPFELDWQVHSLFANSSGESPSCYFAAKQGL